ncbi:response regulator transcription factor [Clostridium sp. 'White wine YQ']|uniref:response regulator transcription factor n=1 Tax=Clostridium sp. 'White wine YQ' TaxID=3027474 RepID=UPI00236569F5|nr:response regulator transcription factor [Clostridium sp. 'White wine YQ']MDD7795814.1 response regulator transcription factor [Clostridium sp. 'White wine YQ']
MIRLLIVDDDELIRESLKIILKMDNNIEVVGTCDNALKAIEICSSNEIDIVLLDVRMPIMNGVEATKELVKNKKTKIIILTTFDEDEYIREGIKNGASGYLLKSTPPKDIIQSIKMVAAGNHVYGSEIIEKLKDSLEKKTTINKELFTERELQIMEAISEGLSNKEVAAKLFISEGTVKNYISSILDKTDLSHRTQIAIYYIKGSI